MLCFWCGRFVGWVLKDPLLPGDSETAQESDIDKINQWGRGSANSRDGAEE